MKSSTFRLFLLEFFYSHEDFLTLKNMLELTNLNDQKLYHLCKFYGEQAKKWRYKFMGLLPEVYKRKLYEKKGFHSVFEFAKKLAGLSEEQVRRVLNLEKRFEETPLLKNLLINGEVSVNKLVRVASIVTKENDEELAVQVKNLPQSALETLVRDERKFSENSAENNASAQNKNGLQTGLFEEKSVRAQSHEELKLSDEVQKKLFELQQKGIDVNDLILEMLKKRELEIAQEKEQISTQLPQTTARYISVQIKKIIQKEHGTKCSMKACHKQAEHIHHTQRFALARRHDPHYLAPLCKNHHIIAHSIDLKFQRKRTSAIN